MLSVTQDLIMPTAITGSYPRPIWFNESLPGRSFKSALGESIFREQYLDAVACVINAQEAAGLDIVTDGDSRFDLAVGGKSWFFYPMRLPCRGHQHRPPRTGPACSTGARCRSQALFCRRRGLALSGAMVTDIARKGCIACVRS